MGDCTLLNHRHDGLFCTPGVMPFSNIYQADGQQFDGWHGMPYPGLPVPVLFRARRRRSRRVMLNNMVEFLWPAVAAVVSAAIRRAGPRRIGLSGTVGTIGVTVRRIHRPCITGVTARRSGAIQPRASSVPRRLRVTAGGQTPLKLVEYVENGCAG
ncbi:hypothetical protein M8494_22600 [Serratia ureilytica]